jgi:hypothetical protein
LGLQAVERRVQRTGLDLQQVFRGSLNVFRYGVTVSGSGTQGAEDEEVEGALQKLHARWWLLAHYVGILLNVV